LGVEANVKAATVATRQDTNQILFFMMILPSASYQHSTDVRPPTR
jgi:hypothetical protein